VLETIKYRPIMIAERHNASAVTYDFYCYLKQQDNFKIDYCLFEGALNSENHINQAETAFKHYWHILSQFLQSDDTTKIRALLHDDLQSESEKITHYSLNKFNPKEYPHGFGQIRNLSVHFLLYHLLKKQKTQWIAIDDKRHVIKKYVQQKINDGTAYLYKQHKNVGNIVTITDKILLEASPIRSKYMSNLIYHYATTGQSLVLIGNRHALDMAVYTPDLADIFGYNPHDDTDNACYYYNVMRNPLALNMLNNQSDYNSYCRPITAYNTQKLKANFGLKQDYLNFLKGI
jgi:hypothetical protein